MVPVIAAVDKGMPIMCKLTHTHMHKSAFSNREKGHFGGTLWLQGKLLWCPNMPQHQEEPPMGTSALAWWLHGESPRASDLLDLPPLSSGV